MAVVSPWFPDRHQPRSSAPWFTNSRANCSTKAERRTATTKTVRETEAEAIAFVVSQTIGLDSGQASADDIHPYHGNAALLTESLEVIQKTSALILSAIEAKPGQAEQTEAQPTTSGNTTDAAFAEVA